MECVREGEVFLPGVSGEADSQRAWRPWVLEEGDGTFRMWYSGYDGTTWRILEAVQHGVGTWERLGERSTPDSQVTATSTGLNPPAW